MKLATPGMESPLDTGHSRALAKVAAQAATRPKGQCFGSGPINASQSRKNPETRMMKSITEGFDVESE